MPAAVLSRPIAVVPAPGAPAALPRRHRPPSEYWDVFEASWRVPR